MPLRDDLTALLMVQGVDIRIYRANAALAALDNGQQLAQSYKTAEAAATAARTAANKAQAGQSDAELALASLETKIDQTKKRLFGGSVTDPHELENLQKQLEMFGRQKDTAEETVLEAMDAATTATQAAEAAEAEQAKVASRYRKVRAAYKEKSASLTEEIAAAQAERKTVVVPVPAALLSRYDGIREKRNGVGAASIRDDAACGACHTALGTHLVDAAFAGVAVQTCENCGRILVPVE